MLKRFIYTFLLLLLFNIPVPVFADIHSWEDENGIRRYSDTPPEMPEGAYDVIEDEKKKPPAEKQQPKSDDLEKYLEQLKARESIKRKERILNKQKAERDEKAKSAYEPLRQLMHLVTGKVDWDEYNRLLADAGEKIEKLADIPELSDVKSQLTDAYKCYAVVPELKKLETAGKQKSLINRIEKMNRDWGTNAPANYFAARRICWQRAADCLQRFSINP